MVRAVFLSILLAGFSPAWSAALVLSPSMDSTLYEDPTGSVSNSQGEGMFVGATGGPSLRRALIAFDLSALPADAVIEEVTLRLTVTRTLSGSTPVSMHAVLAAWGEGSSHAGGSRDGAGVAATPGDPTWLHRSYPNVLWASAGGDFTATASATTDVGDDDTYTWEGAGLVADVQAWLAAPSANHGWLLRDVETGTGTAKRFATGEFPTASLRPSLEIIYTIVPEPGAAVLAAWSLLFVVVWRPRAGVTRP